MVIFCGASVVFVAFFHIQTSKKKVKTFLDLFTFVVLHFLHVGIAKNLTFRLRTLLVIGGYEI